MNLSNIPEHMHQGIIDYIEHGVPPGSFFNAVLENNLVEAAAHADDVNKCHLFDYAVLMYNEFPSASWGSTRRIEEWIKQRGLENA